jgi:RND family efflux transporter MFP subunit
VLGRQDDAEEVSALHQLEINQEQLVRDLNRAEPDRDKNDAARTVYEQRFTQLEESKSRISAQKVRIDSLVLRAPLDGMVLRRDGEMGEIVGPTDVLFWVGPPAPMQVVAEINEDEITRIATGQKAFLRSEAFATQALRATVSQITPKGDPTRKTFRVYLRLPSDTPLRIGMTVEVNIIYREKTAAVVVPAEAVVNNAVQVVSDGKVERVPSVSEFAAAAMSRSSAMCPKAPSCCRRDERTWRMARGSMQRVSMYRPARSPTRLRITRRIPAPVLRSIATPPWSPTPPIPIAR